MTALAAALVGTALLVDTGAEAAFDAPKRLAALVGIVVAAVALVVVPRRARDAAWSWRETSSAQRLALGLAAVAAASALASALLSPRRAVSLDSARTLGLFALLLPLGASRALDRGRSSILIGAFLLASLVNALASVLQSAGIVTLFRVETIGGRLDVSAFVGNDGVLALTLALACVVSGALVLLAGRPPIRLAAGCGLPLFLAGLAINQSLTALIALAAGSVVLIVSLPPPLRRRAFVGAAAVVLVLAGVMALQPAFSKRAREAVSAARDGEWDRLLSYRLGPWAAAVEMARARPLTGGGPGTFGAELVAHRLRAELRYHRRFVDPHLAGSYTEAHSDYLQALAEVGIPGGLAAIAAAGALIVGLLRVAWRAGDDASGREAVLLLAILCAGAAAASTWFPLHRPIMAVPLLLAAGRAWRISGAGGDP